jgi:hypothetical protein
VGKKGVLSLLSVRIEVCAPKGEVYEEGMVGVGARDGDGDDDEEMMNKWRRCLGLFGLGLCSDDQTLSVATTMCNLRQEGRRVIIGEQRDDDGGGRCNERLKRIRCSGTLNSARTRPLHGVLLKCLTA